MKNAKLNAKRILLIITGGIAAYKTPDLIRQLKKAGANVTCVLSPGGAQFVTPLTLQSVSENPVYTDLFSLTQENEMGHIELSRGADIVLVAPATANILAKMAHGLADDLASTVILAANKPILIAPAMNVQMWMNAATQDNVQTLKTRGGIFVGPVEGDMACGEWGEGRLSDPLAIVDAVADYFDTNAPLKGLSAIVTSGPTHEAIDPVRFIANKSSGKQGHAIAQALLDLGCAVTLISGPVDIPPPVGINLVCVESACDMESAVQQALPADIAVCAAAVADWRVADPAHQKIKKSTDHNNPSLKLVENPDILRNLARPGSSRPTLVVGFAAETENLLENARLKLARKGCDWILANNVSEQTGTFGSDQNTVHVITRGHCEDWPVQSKIDVARQLSSRIAAFFAARNSEQKDVSA